MISDIDKIFNEVRTTKLAGSDNFIYEIDLGNENISKTSPLSSDNDDFKKLQDRLPPSYIKFIKNFANGLNIEIGNALTIFPVGQNIGDYWTDVLSLTEETINDNLFPSKDFVFFAADGVGESFAFYTAIQFENGEYPIVWYTPGSVDTNPFVFLNSSFDKFLTMQFYLLKATEGETMDLDEENWQILHDKLYDTFDPSIPKPNHDYFISAINLTQLIEKIKQTKINKP
jgi:hypothetical protein